MLVNEFVKHQMNNIKELKGAKCEGAWIALLDTLRYVSLHEPQYTNTYLKVLEAYEND